MVAARCSTSRRTPHERRDVSDRRDEIVQTLRGRLDALDPALAGMRTDTRAARVDLTDDQRELLHSLGYVE